VGAVIAWPRVPQVAGSGALAFTIVQPDLRQDMLDDPRFYDVGFNKIAALSGAAHPGERRLVLWPESGLPDYLQQGYPQGYYDETTYGGDPLLARQRIARTIGPGSLLLTGAVDLVVQDQKVVGARNTVTAVDAGGGLKADYAKAHLVPFGEYLALRWLLEPLGATRLVPGSLDFLAGPGPRTYDFGPWGKAGMQICYEITFSGQVVDRAHRPDYIFNPSNDGWFGSWGPPQHLAMARLRAAEEGLPVLRSTTTGISAVIDAHGIVAAYVDRLIPGRIDGRIPPAEPPTPFARAGNALPLGIAGLLLVISLVAMRRRSD
jgi:apolipoprotein N-acyltransferase